jgi:hypothetical protein
MLCFICISALKFEFKFTFENFLRYFFIVINIRKTINKTNLKKCQKRVVPSLRSHNSSLLDFLFLLFYCYLINKLFNK